MNYFYSPTKNTFYNSDLKPDYYDALGAWPEDCIQVDDSVYQEFYLGCRDGFAMQPDASNMPSWVALPPPSQEDWIAAAENERQQRLNYADEVMLDWRTELMLGEISDANRAKLSAWQGYKNEVKAVDVTIDPENISWPVPPEA
ncbi:hypothetical protein F384_21440 [Citrobacter amalonaticus Y19]|uniref:Tail fiber assembly protein n=1 Tax=Citrobacter amalonaticus Y19 TaxID=1261127 RepID=A0A0F6TXZ4_CITAM|nr:tail assembly chaperone [Citrobacter amalonaticus]AKE60947.1 hypothetical protein F384_21440 [Citrobacter amalonaticus Y19]